MFYVDMKISLGGSDALMAHHLFDVVYGVAHAKQTLCVGVPQPIG